MTSRISWRIIFMICICLTLLFYKYLLQIFPSVMTESLMVKYNLNGVALGNLTAGFFYGYAVTQIFAGIIVDKFGLKKLATFSLLVAAMGMGIFTASSDIWFTMLGRIFMGIGGAFATICYLRCTASWCDKKSLAFADGSLTIGVMIGAFFAEAPLAIAISRFGLRASLEIMTLIGILLAAICFLFLRDGNNIIANQLNLLANFKDMLRKKQNWLLTAYSGLAFAPLAVFGGLWGTPFIQASHHFLKATSSGLVSLCYIGFGIGGPLFGYLSDRIFARKKMMYIGLLISLFALIGIVYFPGDNKYIIASLMLAMGFGTGAFMLGFAYGKEINNIALAGSIVALINSGDAILGAVTEPLIGKFLDLGYHGATKSMHIFSAHDFHLAFILLLVYQLGAILTLFKIK
jgi:MFS family permease